MNVLEATLLRRLNSHSSPWTKADLVKVRRLGRARLKQMAVRFKEGAGTARPRARIGKRIVAGTSRPRPFL